MKEKRVWIFKEEKKNGEDEYREKFTQAGYQVCFIPVIDFAVCNVQSLAECLTLTPSSQAINSLILTSQKSVYTLNQALDSLQTPFAPEWRQLPVFVVGPETERQLSHSALFAQVRRDHWIQAPCAAELVQPMLDRLAQLPAGGPLFLAGDKRRDLIPQTLTKAGIPFRELSSYFTCPHPQLLSHLQSLQTQQADWAVFFSPSGLKFIQSCLPDFILFHTPAQLHFAAIGPTTADYMHHLGLPPHVVASIPDAHHLSQAILQADLAT